MFWRGAYEIGMPAAEHTSSEDQPPSALHVASFHLLLRISHGRDAFLRIRIRKLRARQPNTSAKIQVPPRMSRLNASAPAGRKKGSFLPDTARNGGEQGSVGVDIASMRFVRSDRLSLR